MTTELKPCPLCGCRAETLHEPEMIHGPFGCVCTDCDVMTLRHEDEASAVEAWNTRPDEDVLRARIAELEQAVCVVASDKVWSTLWVPNKKARISWEGRLLDERFVEVQLSEES